MSLLDKALAMLTGPPPQVYARQEIHTVLSGFGESQSREMARLIEESGTRGAELAMARREVNLGRRYARELERACLAAGAELPRAPDDE